MPYRKGTGKTWYTRVVAVSGRRAVKSTETTLKRTADAVEAWVKDVRQRLDQSFVLEAILDDKISLARAFALGEEGVRNELAEQLAKQLDTDITPLLADWITLKRASPRGAASADDYLRQIETLFPNKPLLKSALTVPRIAHALDTLSVGDATRNRYRAALSGFCKWLVRRGVITTNPAREVGGYAEGEGRAVWYERAVAEAVITAIPDPIYRGIPNPTNRAREAMFAGTGMDWSDASRLRVQDVNRRTWEVRCHGSKTKHRNRLIRVTEGWTIPHIVPAFAGKQSTDLLFPGANVAALNWHRRAVATVGAEYSTLHDWRHTYAVNALRNGLPDAVVAHQLGHGDASLVRKLYGRFVPVAADYEKAIAAGSATNLATSAIPTGDENECPE